MKVECPECRALQDPQWVRANVSGELEVKCQACGVVSVMAASAFRPPSSTPPGQGPVACPKCLHRQGNPESCDRCGLVFARWDPVRATAPTDEAAEALWAAVLADWPSDQKHRGFVEYCTAMGLYAYAAQQYGAARADSAHRERAVAEISRLATLAATALAASTPRARGWTVPRIRAVMIVVTLVVSGGLLLLIASRFLF